MIRIGLTGGIGSGKSVVAELLKINGIPVYVADKESKRLTESSPFVRKKLIELLGKEVYTDQGLNRMLLASYIFGNEENLNVVNQIIHPVVLYDFIEWSERQQQECVAIESAILFESGFDKQADKVIMVSAPLETRIKRVQNRDHLSTEEINKRIESQWPEEIKCRKADLIIQNDNQTALIPQVNAIVSFFTDAVLPAQ